MNENIQILIDAILSKDVEGKLQKQLDKMAKNLKLNIKNIQGNTKESKQQTEQVKQQTNAIKQKANEQKKINQLQREEMQLTKQIGSLKRQSINANKGAYQEIVKHINGLNTQRGLVRDLLQGQEQTNKQKRVQYNEEMKLNKVMAQRKFEEEKRGLAGYKWSNIAGDSKALQNQVVMLNSLDARIVQTTKSMNKHGKVLTRIKTESKGVNNTMRIQEGILNEQTGEFRLLSEGIQDASRQNQSWAQSTATAIQRTVQWSIAMGLLYGNIRRLQEGIEIIKELDKQITQIALVTGESKSSVNDLVQEYSDLALEIGQTTVKLTESAQGFFRQGLSVEEVNERLKSTVTLSNVLGTEMSETAEQITAAVNSMGVEAGRVGDIVAAIGANAGTSGEELLTVIQKTGAGAKTAGMSLEQLASISGSVLEKTRLSAEEIGAAMNTLIAKFSRVKSDTGEINKDFDKVVNAIESIGVKAIDEQTGALRNIYDILGEVGQRWDGLSKKQQAYIQSSIGVRQFSKFAAVLSSTERQQELLEVAMDSSGTVMEQNAVYMDSVQASADRMRVAFEQLFMNALNSDNIKTFYEIVTALTKLIDKAGLVNTVVTGLAFVFLSANTSLSNFATNALVPFNETIRVSILRMFNSREAIDANTASTNANTGATITNTSEQGVLSATLVGTKVATMGAAVATQALTAALTLGLSLALMPLLSGLTNLILNYKSVEEKQKELIESSIEQSKALRQETKELQDYISKSEEYKNNKENLIDINNQLAEKYPELVKGIDEEGNFIMESTSAINEYIDAKKQQRKEELSATTGNIDEQIKRQKEKVEGLREEFNELKKLNDLKIIQARGQVFEYDITDENNQIRQEKIDEIRDEEKELKNLLNIQNEIKKINQEEAIELVESSNAYKNKTDASEDLKNKLKDLGFEYEDIVKVLDKSNKKLKSQEDGFVNVDSITEKAKKTVKDYGENMKEINQVLQDVQENEEYNVENVMELSEKYPELLTMLDDRQALEEKLLEIKREMPNTTAKALEQEVKLVQESVRLKIKAYGAEMEGLDMVNQTRIEALKIALESAQSIGQAQAIQVEIDKYYTLRDRIDALSGSIGKMNNLGIKTKKQKKEEEVYVSELINRYGELEEAIEGTNRALQRNSEFTSTASEQEKLGLLKERIGLLKTLQSQMHNLNKERRKEREELIQNLNLLGKSANIYAKIVNDQAIIVGMENINNVTGKNVEETNKLKKEIEETIESINDRNQAIQNEGDNWWKVNSDIMSQMKELSDSIEEQKEKIKEFNEETSSLIQDSLSEQREVLENAISSLKKYEEEQEKLIEQSDERIKSLEDELEALQRQYMIEQDSLPIQEQIKEINQAIADEKQKLADFQEEINKKIEAQKQLIEDIKDKYNAQIDALKNQKNKSDEINKEKERQLDLEEKLLAVEKAREALAKAKEQRTAKVFNKELGRFELVADPREIKKKQEDLNNALADLNETQKKNEEEREKERIDNQIEELERLRDAKINEAEKELELLENIKTEREKATEDLIANFEKEIEKREEILEKIKELYVKEELTIEQKLELKREELAEELYNNEQLREDLDKNMEKYKDEIKDLVKAYNKKKNLREQDEISFKDVWNKENQTINDRIEAYMTEYESLESQLQNKLELRQKDLIDLENYANQQISMYQAIANASDIANGGTGNINLGGVSGGGISGSVSNGGFNGGSSSQFKAEEKFMKQIDIDNQINELKDDVRYSLYHSLEKISRGDMSVDEFKSHKWFQPEKLSDKEKELINLYDSFSKYLLTESEAKQIDYSKMISMGYSGAKFGQLDTSAEVRRGLAKGQADIARQRLSQIGTPEAMQVLQASQIYDRDDFRKWFKQKTKVEGKDRPIEFHEALEGGYIQYGEEIHDLMDTIYEAKDDYQKADKLALRNKYESINLEYKENEEKKERSRVSKSINEETSKQLKTQKSIVGKTIQVDESMSELIENLKDSLRSIDEVKSESGLYEIGEVDVRSQIERDEANKKALERAGVDMSTSEFINMRTLNKFTGYNRHFENEEGFFKVEDAPYTDVKFTKDQSEYMLRDSSGNIMGSAIKDKRAVAQLLWDTRGRGLSLENVQTFATGGIATKPSICGESGTEVVVNASQFKDANKFFDILTNSIPSFNKDYNVNVPNQISNNNTTSSIDKSINIANVNVKANDSTTFVESLRKFTAKI